MEKTDAEPQISTLHLGPEVAFAGIGGVGPEINKTDKLQRGRVIDPLKDPMSWLEQG